MKMDRVSSFFAYLWSVIIGAFGLFTINEWATLIGVIIGFATFFTNRHYKRKEDARKAEVHSWNAQMFELDYQIKKKQSGGGNESIST
ncbi:HP1 family phage holin [Yersinia intermedia]|uniref:HP1 family phage holin n=1 Tax=Yersinia intermedia TaxID=631 RepID=UPI0022FF0BF1|nr:HP1 family phage holin [Yersinia intermedia]MDA5482167.1 HP1 family phage holin [Yersinia intermedia]